MRRLLAGKAAPAVLTGVVMLSIAGGGIALAAGTGGGSIKACIKKGSHALYEGPCAKHDKQITLSKTGRTGPAGARGQVGPTGAAGTPGVAGTPGAQGVPGPTGVVTFGSWAGDVATIAASAPLTFTGPTTTLTTTAGQSIMATGEASLAVTATPVQAVVSICKSPATGTPTVTLLDPMTGSAVSSIGVTTTKTTFAANGTGTPGAGSWKIGECVQNDTATPINSNDWALGYAFVVNGTPTAGSS